MTVNPSTHFTAPAQQFLVSWNDLAVSLYCWIIGGWNKFWENLSAIWSNDLFLMVKLKLLQIGFSSHTRDVGGESERPSNKMNLQSNDKEIWTLIAIDFWYFNQLEFSWLDENSINGKRDLHNCSQGLSISMWLENFHVDLYQFQRVLWKSWCSDLNEFCWGMLKGSVHKLWFLIAFDIFH